MSKVVTCSSCNGVIKYRDEFVAGLFFVAIIPYHTDCFSRELKKSTALVLANEPINGVLGTFSAVVSGLASLGFLFFGVGLFKWFALLLAIPTLYRMMAYVLYERHLYE